MKIDLFINLKCHTTTRKLSLSMKYSKCDLICDVN